MLCIITYSHHWLSMLCCQWSVITSSIRPWQPTNGRLSSKVMILDCDHSIGIFEVSTRFLLRLWQRTLRPEHEFDNIQIDELLAIPAISWVDASGRWPRYIWLYQWLVLAQMCGSALSVSSSVYWSHCVFGGFVLPRKSMLYKSMYAICEMSCIICLI